MPEERPGSCPWEAPKGFQPFSIQASRTQLNLFKALEHFLFQEPPRLPSPVFSLPLLRVQASTLSLQSTSCANFFSPPLGIQSLP